MKKFFLIVMLIVSVTYSQTTSKENNDMSKEEIVNVIANSAKGIIGLVSERVITTSIIIGEVIILFLLLYYWKRTKNDSKTQTKNIYRKNIKALRDERIKPYANSKQSSRRRVLLKKIDLKSINSNTITTSARKLSISKGELFLAAKIAQLQNQYNER